MATKTDPATVCLERMGMVPVPYKPRCDFGAGHTWASAPDQEEHYYCTRCGVVDSQHPVSLAASPRGTEA